MPKARVHMSKVREVIRLNEIVGLSVRKISRALNVSRPAVDHYLRQARRAGLCWESIEHISDEVLLQRLQHSEENHNDPRYRELVVRIPDIVSRLGNRHVTRQLLWEQYRAECPDGYEYSQFCYHIKIYTSDSEISMHIEHEPGRKLFVDFAGDRPHLTDPKTGLEQPVELFVAVFPASGLVYCEATATQSSDDLIPATRHALEYAGGSPAIIVPDNLKSAVTKPCRYEPDINQQFEDFGRYYGCVVIPARVRKPQDKALVEAAVRLVYTRILAQLVERRFATCDELNEAIWEYLELLNDRKMQKVRVSRRERFEELEAHLLTALPVRPYTIRRFINEVTVQINYHVYFTVDKHYYSVPYQHRRKKVRIAYTERDIEIYHNNIRIASHRRARGKNQYTTTHDHMPRGHEVMSNWTPERLISWAADIGEHTERLVAAVLEDREVPEQAFKSCLGILSLAKKFGPQRLEAAAVRANEYRVVSYKGVRNILERGLDRHSPRAVKQFSLSSHENIRGGAYYADTDNGGGR